MLSNILGILHYIFIKRQKSSLLGWYLLGILERRIRYYCKLCGGWFRPAIQAFSVEEGCCEECWYIAKAKTQEHPLGTVITDKFGNVYTYQWR